MDETTRNSTYVLFTKLDKPCILIKIENMKNRVGIVVTIIPRGYIWNSM